MAFKKRPLSGANRGSKDMFRDGYVMQFERSVSSGTFTVTAGDNSAQDAPVETIEARLERKASEADGKVFATKSLGQMSREERHKLLYGY